MNIIIYTCIVNHSSLNIILPIFNDTVTYTSSGSCTVTIDSNDITDMNYQLNGGSALSTGANYKM